MKSLLSETENWLWDGDHKLKFELKIWIKRFLIFELKTQIKRFFELKLCKILFINNKFGENFATCSNLKY
ncbi:hypothetical protein ASJ81_07935 [Methanosarcina spelaei]|uniref:Uncharacterized protein n=1 Tax=Methanosarcina spelaei TaxID=1036679 RepID=A0A2A2HRW3_9EURY|nr:hypothetical protein ASJ81_07935 [Methanosarcina spelaei]